MEVSPLLTSIIYLHCKVAECLMTDAIIDLERDFAYREPKLVEALDLCIKAYGENHLLTARLLLNMGMAYDMQYEEVGLKRFVG